MYKGTENLCCKYEQQKETFYHAWWMYKKARKYWVQIHTLIQKINIQLKSEAFLWVLMDKQIAGKESWSLLFIHDNCRKIFIWCKDVTLPTMKRWMINMMELAEKGKLTSSIREKILFMFIADS